MKRETKKVEDERWREENRWKERGKSDEEWDMYVSSNYFSDGMNNSSLSVLHIQLC